MKINKDTKICISLASNPGNFGALVHNYCYEQFRLNYIYLPLTTNSFNATLDWIRNTPNVVGCSISMPWKKEATKYVENSDEFENINTIYKHDGCLWGWSSDLFAINSIFTEFKIVGKNVCILGNGAMASNFYKVLAPVSKKIVKLNRQEIDSFNFNYKDRYDVVVNATPVGMKENETFTNYAIRSLIQYSDMLIDCVVSKYNTKIVEMSLNKKCVCGMSLALIQAAKQFEIYTGVEFSTTYLKMKEVIIANDYAT